MVQNISNVNKRNKIFVFPDTKLVNCQIYNMNNFKNKIETKLCIFVQL